MGCQSTVTLGDNLTFTVTTHDPDSGVLTDADAVPSYRIYEDETGAAILNGNMAKLDDANTTGFYSELIACTTVNGFEVDKSYNIYIQATVDSDTGGISFAFTAQNVPADVWTHTPRTLTMSAASVASAVAGDTISIVRGDTLSAEITDIGALTNYVSIDWSVKKDLDDDDDDAILWVRLNDPSVNDGLLRVNGAAATDATKGSITVDDLASGDITIAVDATITDDLVIEDLYYDIQLITAASVTTRSIGTGTVIADITRAVA